VVEPVAGDRHRAELVVGSSVCARHAADPAQRARHQACGFRLVKQLKSARFFCWVRYRHTGTNCDLAEAVFRSRAGNDSVYLGLQIGIFEGGMLCQSAERSCETTGHRAQKKVFRRPPSLHATKGDGCSEMNGVGCRIRFRNASTPRSPPSDSAKLMCLFHLNTP